MRETQLRNRKGAAIDRALIEAFAGDFGGRVILSDNPEYNAARKIWNASIDRYPGLIARCAGTADIVKAIGFARANDLLVAIRSGGHNVGGRALCDDGIVIDLSAMKGVFVDPAQRTVRVQAGATLGDVDRETHAYGLAVPAGVVSKTGIAGLTLGGGVGWLVRKYGLTCDNVLSFEVVTAEGALVTASAESNSDLFWALRGGGGNFGVVASFLYRAHPVSAVLGGLIVYPRDQAAAVLRHYRDFIAKAPEELTAYAALISTPDGTPAVGVIACYCGDVSEGERVLKPLRSFGSPLADMIQLMPFPMMQKLLDGAFPDGTFNYWKSTFIKDLSDAAIDTIIEHGNRARSPLSGIVIEFYCGAANRIGDSETAFAQRGGRYDVGIMAQWTDAAEDAQHVTWTRALSDALKPYASGGYLLNFLGEDESQATIQAAFGANYARLAQVKAKYDPNNFFSINQNIRPL